MNKKIIASLLLCYSGALHAMQKNTSSEPIEINSRKKDLQTVNASYYDTILNLISCSWDSSPNYPTYCSSLENHSDLSDTETNRSGSIVFESKNQTPVSSPRNNVEQHQELIHEFGTKKNFLYSLCCCCLKKNYTEKNFEYEQIK